MEAAHPDQQLAGQVLQTFAGVDVRHEVDQERLAAGGDSAGRLRRGIWGSREDGFCRRGLQDAAGSSNVIVPFWRT